MKVSLKMSVLQAAKAREKEKHERALKWRPVVKTWVPKAKAVAAKAS